jgi:hypothetical protein
MADRPCLTRSPKSMRRVPPTKSVKSYKVGRICETKDCTTRLSIYNKDTICDACHTAIPLENLPYKNIAKFL